MKTQEIAQTLLQRRNSMSPVVMPGEMLATIGSDAMQEALQRRWLVPSTETGFLQVSADMNKVTEMRDIAEKCPTCGMKECKCEHKEAQTESHNLSVGHASRHPNFLHELLSPATGHDPEAVPPPQAAATPTAPPPPGAALKKPTIGDSVVVGEDGKVYTGTVGSVQGGRYKVSFGPEKPRTMRDYAENEVKLVKPLQPATATR